MLITYVTLLTIVLGGLAIPLGITIAARDTQRMLIDRVNDTARFASLVESRTGNGNGSAPGDTAGGTTGLGGYSSSR